MPGIGRSRILGINESAQNVDSSNFQYTSVADNELRMVTEEFCKPLQFVVHGIFKHIEVEFVNHCTVGQFDIPHCLLAISVAYFN